MGLKNKHNWFFIFGIIYAVWKIFESFAVVIPGLGHLFSRIFFPFSVIWVILSLAMLFIFLKEKMPKIYLVLPIYYIADFIFSLGLGFVISIMSARAASGQLAGASWLIYLTVAMSIFEIAFASYMLSRK